MTGILQTTLLLLCSSRLARWLMTIGLTLTVIGLVAMVSSAHTVALPLFVVALIVGTPAVVVAPVLLGPMIFRAFSSPHAIGLIPGNRLKLALGALTTQLLLALFISGVVTAMMRHPFAPQASTVHSDLGRLWGVFVVAFGALSLQFLGYYWSSQYRFGGLWLVGVAQFAWLIDIGLREWDLRISFTTATGLDATLAVSVFAWVGFASVFLRASFIRPPYLSSFGTGTPASSRSTLYDKYFASRGPLNYTSSEAIGVLLSGFPRRRLSPFSRSMLMLMIFLVLMALAMAIGNHASGAYWLSWGAIVCPLAGPVAWGNASRLAARSKLLWMTSGLERADLFRQIEKRSWRVVFGFFALGVVFVAIRYGLHPGSAQMVARVLPPTWAIIVLVVPLISGATCIYSGLHYVRGRRIVDIMVLAGCLVFWFLDIFCGMAGVAMQTITALLALQVILVAPLRVLALRRWQRIDWVIYRPLRRATGIG
jgi:hypothetical protein